MTTCSQSMGCLRSSLSLAALGFATLLAGCERPPMDSVQVGYRGTGMVQINNPRTQKVVARANAPAPPAAPAAADDGPRAKDIYQNVQVLGDLSVGEFTRVMAAITQWVSPEQGCAYCHEGANLAEDTLYTKVVARRMLQMTQTINAQWKPHVGDAGVTCYTCHRGNNVPQDIWFKDTGPKRPSGYASDGNRQNMVGEAVGRTSLPFDPFSIFLEGDEQIGVAGAVALPAGNTQTIKDAESTYGLMIHMSKSLGVNCSYCHNTRTFASWEESRPQRVTAWHGIEMVRTLNNDFLVPLGPEYPESRVGPHGDAPKASCATCHAGVSKPLYGAKMAGDYPSLQSMSSAP